MSDCNWFVRHRQDWIAETVRIFEFINREHLERKFGISTPQASMDLRQFQEERPGVIEYNRSTKRYELVCCTPQKAALDVARERKAAEDRERYQKMTHADWPKDGFVNDYD